jgi:hypothetical protein
MIPVSYYLFAPLHNQLYFYNNDYEDNTQLIWVGLG